MNEWRGLRALVYDLDGTLYDSPELLAAYPRLAMEYMAERLGLARDEAGRRYEQEREAEWEATGISPSTTRILVALTGASLDEWAEFVASRLDPAGYLDPADYGWLRDLLECLHRYYRQGIVSNNNRVVAGRILDRLGIRGLFDEVLTTSESGRLKPDPTLYLEMAEMLGVRPGECLSIGDRLAVDVIPAEQAGLRGFLVSGPADLRALSAELLAAAGAHEPAVEATWG